MLLDKARITSSTTPAHTVCLDVKSFEIEKSSKRNHEFHLKLCCIVLCVWCRPPRRQKLILGKDAGVAFPV
jgi:hypothetical protein